MTTRLSQDRRGAPTAPTGRPHGFHRRHSRHLAGWWHLDLFGTASATVGVLAALSPSLMPRPWSFAGILAGIVAALAYGIGVAFGWVVRRRWHRPLPSDDYRRMWRALLAVTVPVLVTASIASGIVENQIRSAVDLPPRPVVQALAALLVMALTFGVLVAAGRLVRLVTRALVRRLDRRLPHGISETVGILAVAMLTYWSAAGLIEGAALHAADTFYADRNTHVPAGTHAPTTSERSGGPGSLAPWTTLGLKGRAFVSTGPTPAQISAVTARPARQPIRVYAGLESAPTIRARADLVLRELQRTHAFEREVLVVAGTTGTGWLEPHAVAAVEYIWGGDTAIAGIQYSALPSWISLIADRSRATEAGRAIFDTIYDYWRTLPPGSRPRLYVYGLSLGSYGIQSAFGSPQDLAARTDGALFVGTPNFTPLRTRIFDDRDPGSPEWQPVYRDGRTVRVGAAAGDLSRPTTTWPAPRIVYLQHASDPIVWWNPLLVTREPDWLTEPRGPDVVDHTRWLPLVTFLQITVDQVFAARVPQGHGHNYVDTAVYGWEQVGHPAWWTSGMAAKAQEVLNRDVAATPGQPTNELTVER